ncbi:hypothetical protein [Brevundimonas sp. Root1279]|uniref:hypothetical protein n=1 Tax=Brevundimonas sp. Root1279 TaxID=1736443 RepID=UPI0006F42652|nr:hypothetical protein [Brevundimonas sp. Root1279]KQW82929.1 hypothetical protein ASC65_06170 [Brevundimonas sp. Root1279]
MNLRLPLIVAALTALAAPAVAQTAPPLPRAGLYVDPHRYQADRHRYEMDRLRQQADDRAAFARQLQLESQLSRMEVQAARQPDLALPAGYRALRSPEEERALRQSATERRETVQSGVGEIDAWLDRDRTEPQR